MRLLVLGLLATACATARPAPEAAIAPPPSCLVAPAIPAPSATKDEDVHKLLLALGSDKLAAQTANQMIDLLLPMMQSAPPAFRDAFVVEMRKELNPDTLLALTAPAYAERFSQEQILQLIALFQSPIGQKYVAELPALTRMAMQAGESWGKAAGERAVKRAQEQLAK